MTDIVEVLSGLAVKLKNAKQFESAEIVYSAVTEITSLRAQVEELSQYPEGAVTEESVLKAVYESGLHQYAPGVLKTIWKDSIDIDAPSASLMNFSRKLAAIFKEKQGVGK